MSEPPRVTGIVLAGGRSTRFGRNKLAEPVRGVPLLHLAISALATCCAEVLVVEPATGPRVATPASMGDGTPIVTVADPEPYPGPLAALLTGAKRAAHPLLLLAGGDMPDLHPGVLTLLLDTATRSRPMIGAALGVGPTDSPQLLPIALARAAVIQHVPGLLSSGRRSLFALVERVAPLTIPEPEWRALDPAALTLHDIDRPDELGRG